MNTEGAEARHGFVKKLERHVKALTNGGRGKLPDMSDALVSVCEALMFIMQVDYVTKDYCFGRHNLQWRVLIKDIIITLGSVLAICATILRLKG